VGKQEKGKNVPLRWGVHFDNLLEVLVNTSQKLVDCCLRSGRRMSDSFFPLSNEINSRSQSLSKRCSGPATPFPPRTEMRIIHPPSPLYHITCDLGIDPIHCYREYTYLITSLLSGIDPVYPIAASSSSEKPPSV
jgi:hypothetical protein